MELTEDWVAIPADDELRRTFADPDLDTAGWEPVAVPGHWRSSPAFAAHDGPLLHRTRFERRPVAGRRQWLRFEGLFHQGDVWLDGAYLGDTEGYFTPHAFEITDTVADRAEHVLAVELTCAPQAPDRPPRNTTGAFQDADVVDPGWNPGGIWRPVRVEDTGPVRIARLTTRCTQADPSRAVVSFEAELDAAAPVDVHVRTTLGAVDHGHDHTLAAGPNTVEWSVTVEDPTLWWPRALGPADLVPVQVEVRLPDAAGSAVSDRRRFHTGLRSLRMRNWVLSVNGERLFCKGANLLPSRMALGEASEAECRRDVELATAAGLDLVRLHAHVARPETYDAADRAGMLVWQDFPLGAGHPRQVRWQAVRQAAEMVHLLGHHPSVAVWCGHTRSVRRAIHRTDGTRPVVDPTDVLPHVPRPFDRDRPLYLGWYRGDERQLPALARAVPNRVRFPTEFGSQAVPPIDDFVDPGRWPDLDWERLASHHHLQLELLDRHVPRAGRSYEEWREATQRYQADLVRHHVETLRRLKYRPTGGFAQFAFADPHPSISWSVLDHERRPKPAHAALVAACRPVIVVADRPPAEVHPGDALALDVHVVSDRRVDLDGHVDVELRWDGGAHRWSFEGAIPADSCVRVGTVQFEVPDTTGELVLELSGSLGGDPVDNRYATTVTVGR